MQALITVSDKRDIDYFAKELNKLNIKIISTGGTYKELSRLKLNIDTIENYTNSKEILSGRVKTLHPKIYGGILAIRDNKAHIEDLRKQNIETIDFVVVNLYPFEEVTKKDNISLEKAIENIDIGGVTLIRAAAKNFRYTTVISDPTDYKSVINELKEKGEISLNTRYSLALKAFKKTASYDNVIYKYLLNKNRQD